MKQEILKMLSDKLGVDLEDIKDDSDLFNDLGADSLDYIEIVMESEKMFNCAIPDEDAEDVRKVEDFIKLVEKYKKE